MMKRFAIRISLVMLLGVVTADDKVSG